MVTRIICLILGILFLIFILFTNDWVFTVIDILLASAFLAGAAGKNWKKET